MPSKPLRLHWAKVSKAEQELLCEVLQYLPASRIRETLHVTLRKVLHTYFPDIRYYLEGTEAVAFHDFLKNLQSPCCAAVLGLKPFRENAFVVFDSMLASVVVEKLLGGKGEALDALRPLTETEQGIIEFLILKLLRAVHQESGGKEKMHFRLEQMVSESSRLKQAGPAELPLVCLKIHVSLLNRSGFLYLYLPHPWILEGFLKDLEQDRSSILFRDMKRQLPHFGFLETTLKAVVGETLLQQSSLKGLEEGDIVLFDTSDLLKSGENWEGTVRLVAGEGESGGFTADWKGFRQKGRCMVTGSLRGGKVYG